MGAGLASGFADLTAPLPRLLVGVAGVAGLLLQSCGQRRQDGQFCRACANPSQFEGSPSVPVLHSI
jgi:hypothetical protein